MKNLKTTHMFFIGAGIALLAGVGLAAFKGPSVPAPPGVPTAPAQATFVQEEKAGLFQSLFQSEKVSAAPPVSPLVPPAQNKDTAPEKPQIVKFTTPRDLAPVVARYPFLGEMAKDMHAARTRPDIFSAAPSLNYAEFTDPVSGQRILLVLAEGSGFCGSAGCYAAIHVDGGAGFGANKYSFNAGGNIYYRLDRQTGLSVFTCEGNSVEEFRLVKGQINSVTPASVNAATLPGCTTP